MYLELTLALYLLIPGFCEDCLFTIHSDSGEIQSPNYPFGYLGNIQCIWDISSLNGTQLSLYFDVFDLEFDANCDRDSLTISGGPRQVIACGNTINRETLTSQSDFFKLEFHTDPSNKEFEIEKGFHAIFNAITHDVESTVDGARMSFTTETGEHREVRSSTPIGDSLSSIASTKDTTNRPRTAVVTQSTFNPPSPVKNTTVSIIIGVSVATVVGMVITIGLIILFIKRKKSNSKTNMPRHLRNLSVEMYSIEPSTIESNKSATMELNVGAGNQDVYTVPMKKNVRKEEIYQDNLTEYDSLNTSRPKINGSGESNVYNMTTAVTDNVYGTNKKDDVIGNEFYDSMGRIAMSEPGGNELYDTATNNGYTSNDVIVPDGSYGIIL